MTSNVQQSQGVKQKQQQSLVMPKKQIFCRDYQKIGDTVLVNVPVAAASLATSTTIGETNVFAHSVPYHNARSNCFFAWLSCVCFAPVGLISVAFSAFSTYANRKKDFVSALEHGKTAYKLAFAGIVAGAAVYSVLLIVSFVGAVRNGNKLSNNTFVNMELERFGI